MDMSWLCSQTIPEESATDKNNGDNNRGKAPWVRKTRETAARSKTTIWGPSHSLSSDEGDEKSVRPKVLFEKDKKNETEVDTGFSTPPSKPAAANNCNNNSQDTASTKSSHESTPPTDEDGDRVESMGTIQGTLGQV